MRRFFGVSAMKLRNQESSSSHRICYSLSDLAAQMKTLPLSLFFSFILCPWFKGRSNQIWVLQTWLARARSRGYGEFYYGHTNDRHDGETKILLPASMRFDGGNDWKWKKKKQNFTLRSIMSYDFGKSIHMEYSINIFYEINMWGNE